MTTKRWRKVVKRFLFYAVLVAVMVPFLFVFYWMFISSFKTQLQNQASPPLFWVTPNLNNYRDVFANNPFGKYIINSMIVAAGATGIALVAGLPAAYSIARWKQRGLALAILTARIAPGISFLVPWFVLFTKLRLTDTYMALILTHVVVTLPLIVWLLISYYEDLPDELEDAARVDGCSIFGSFWHIATPLIRPGIAAGAILAFIQSWNNFMFSLVLSSQQTKTLPVAVFSFMTYTNINWGGLTAAATLITLPVMLLVLLVQRNIVRGLVMGAVKG